MYGQKQSHPIYTGHVLVISCARVTGKGGTVCMYLSYCPKNKDQVFSLLSSLLSCTDSSNVFSQRILSISDCNERTDIGLQNCSVSSSLSCFSPSNNYAGIQCSSSISTTSKTLLAVGDSLHSWVCWELGLVGRTPKCVTTEHFKFPSSERVLIWLRSLGNVAYL